MVARGWGDHTAILSWASFGPRQRCVTPVGPPCSVNSECLVGVGVICAQAAAYERSCCCIWRCRAPAGGRPGTSSNRHPLPGQSLETRRNLTLSPGAGSCVGSFVRRASSGRLAPTPLACESVESVALHLRFRQGAGGTPPRTAASRALRGREGVWVWVPPRSLPPPPPPSPGQTPSDSTDTMNLRRPAQWHVGCLLVTTRHAIWSAR